MANIVSAEDFKGMIMLPQINATIDTGVATVTPVLDSLTQFIAEKEPEVLIKLLGVGFYRDLIAGLGMVEVPEKWELLVDGTYYQNGQDLWFKYEGLKPLILRYVYYYWLRQEATQTTGVGEAVNKTENAQRTSPAQKQTTAWNDMVQMCKSTYHYLYTESAVYPEWVTPNQYNDYGNYNYLGCNYRWRRNELLIPINALSI